MIKNDLCYLDNAATSFPKPTNVAREVKNCIEKYCGNAGRGAHKLSLFAANKIYECREAICNLINAPSPENIAFVPSCTYGLNLIIKGLLRQGDHVIISDMEHNAVLRPIYKLSRDGLITFDIFAALSKLDQTDEELLVQIEKHIKPNTKLLICNHQSNICSYFLPLSKIGALCKKNNILFALDTAQSMGHINIDMQKMNINFLSAPAHKGLYGLQGCGFVAINSSRLLNTLIEGGNGINSLLPDMPDFSPERYEVGTLPLPAIVGLNEGIKFITRNTIGEIHRREKELYCYLRDNLMNIAGVSVHAPKSVGSTLSFSAANLPISEICAALDEANICVRGGLHCSALAHKSIKTDQTGTIRVSFGVFNTINNLDRLLTCVNNLVTKTN